MKPHLTDDFLLKFLEVIKMEDNQKKFFRENIPNFNEKQRELAYDLFVNLLVLDAKEEEK